jgi:hypothetical protein
MLGPSRPIATPPGACAHAFTYINGHEINTHAIWYAKRMIRGPIHMTHVTSGRTTPRIKT